MRTFSFNSPKMFVTDRNFQCEIKTTKHVSLQSALKSLTDGSNEEKLWFIVLGIASTEVDHMHHQRTICPIS